VKDSAAIYAEFVSRLAAGERFGARQSGKGRLYQVKQRSLKQEQELDRRLKEGILKNLTLPPRVVWFEQRTSMTKELS
jgi:hypothetical protein